MNKKKMAVKNSNIQKFCKKMGITEAQFYGKEKIKGDLCTTKWRKLEYFPNGICLDVIGKIMLDSIKELPENCKIFARDCIDMCYLTHISKGCELNSATGNLYLNSVTSIDENCKLQACWLLDLSSLTEMPDSTSIKVFNKLDIRSLKKKPAHGFTDVKSEIRYQ